MVGKIDGQETVFRFNRSVVIIVVNMNVAKTKVEWSGIRPEYHGSKDLAQTVFRSCYMEAKHGSNTFMSKIHLFRLLTIRCEERITIVELFTLAGLQLDF